MLKCVDPTMYYVIFLVGLVSYATAAIQDETFAGKCPFDHVTYVRGFEQKRFEGTWYEIQRYHTSDNMDCVEDSYKWEPFDAFAGKFNIRHKERNLQKNDEKEELKEISQAFRFPGQYFVPGEGWPIWVVNTDYNNYALLWSCWDEFTPEKRYNIQRVTILARNRNFQLKSVPSLQSLLEKQPFDMGKLKAIVQDERCTTQDGGNNNDDNSATLTIPTILSTILMILACKLL